jgi:hypothetical protein
MTNRQPAQSRRKPDEAHWSTMAAFAIVLCPKISNTLIVMQSR